MIVVDKTNLDSAITKNVKEILDTNSLSVDVKSSYSKNSTLPVIITETETRQVTKGTGRSSTPVFVATVTIHNIHKVYGSALEQRGVIRNLLDTNDSIFSQYNMELHDVRDNYTTIQRGEGRVHNAILIVQFVIK